MVTIFTAWRNTRFMFRFFLSKLRPSIYPLALRWNITANCPNSCTYCNGHLISTKNIANNQIDQMIKNVIALSPLRLSISGGEPLSCEYFEKIVEKLSEKKISLVMNTSGHGIEKYEESLKKIDLVQLSLDGPSEITTKMRGPQTYERTLNAIKFCLENKIKFSFCMTMTKYNISKVSLQFMLNLANKYNTFVAFQPIKKVFMKEKEFAELSPAPHEFRSAINFLISEKKSKNKAIRNSTFMLKSLLNWPHYPKLKCTAGKLFFVIQADGSIVSCDRIEGPLKNNLNILTTPTQNITKMLQRPDCDGCGFCGATELNLLSDLKFSVFEVFKKL